MYSIYMYIIHGNTLALRNQKEKKGEVTHPSISQTNNIHIHVHVARDTWMHVYVTVYTCRSSTCTGMPLYLYVYSCAA